jgi:hypothetical protein
MLRYLPDDASLASSFDIPFIIDNFTLPPTAGGWGRSTGPRRHDAAKQVLVLHRAYVMNGWHAGRRPATRFGTVPPSAGPLGSGSAQRSPIRMRL